MVENLMNSATLTQCFRPWGDTGHGTGQGHGYGYRLGISPTTGKKSFKTDKPERKLLQNTLVESLGYKMLF